MGEGLAVMLSVVVFGLGVMTLVAREEVRPPPASADLFFAPLSAGVPGAPADASGAPALPAGSAAR